MERLYRYIRFLAYAIEILAFYIVEQIPNLIPHINNVRPIILLPVAAMIALFEGSGVGLLFGFIIGLFLDCGATGSIGFYSVVVTCLSFLVGIAAERIINFNLLTSAAIAIAFTSALYLLHFLVEFILRGYPDTLYVLLNHYLVGLLYTSLLAPFVYFFNKAFAMHIRERE